MANAQAGQIVIVNGTSGSGKSTTCELFSQKSEDFWLLYGIDHFLSGTFPSKFGHHGPKANLGIEAVPVDESDPDGPLRWRFNEYGLKAFNAVHEWIASSSRAGCNMIFDHLLMTDPPVIPDIAWRLEGLPALLVTLKPPFDVLEKRVAERAMTKKLPVEILGEDAVNKIVARLARLRPWFYDEIYRNDVADLVIDSDKHSPEAIVAMIQDRLAQGPGTAFDELRRRFPKN